MCLATPYKVIKISGQNAEACAKNKNKLINISLLKNVKIGDWILCLNNFAIQKINAQEAKQIINLYNYDKNK